MGDNKRQAGFTAIEIVLVVVVLGLIGFTAVKAFDAHNVASQVQTPIVQAVTTSPVPAAPAIANESDLSTATSTVDSVNVDENSSDGSQLETDLNSF